MASNNTQLERIISSFLPDEENREIAKDIARYESGIIARALFSEKDELFRDILNSNLRAKLFPDIFGILSYPEINVQENQYLIQRFNRARAVRKLNRSKDMTNNPILNEIEDIYETMFARETDSTLGTIDSLRKNAYELMILHYSNLAFSNLRESDRKKLAEELAVNPDKAIKRAYQKAYQLPTRALYKVDRFIGRFQWSLNQFNELVETMYSETGEYINLFKLNSKREEREIMLKRAGIIYREMVRQQFE